MNITLINLYLISYLTHLHLKSLEEFIVKI